MNDHEIVEMPELEERLRAYFSPHYGAAPSADALWRRVAQQLEVNDLRDDAERSLDFIRPALNVSGAPDLRTRLGQVGARKGWVARGTALAAAILLVALGAAIFHAFAPSRSSRTVAPIQATPVTQQIHFLASDELLVNADLNDVQMLSATDGWAVGDRVTATGTFRSLILHYSDGRWREDPFVINGASLRWISMDSPTDGWAGGELGMSGFLLHYAHRQWSAVAAPDGLPVIAIQMLSPSEGWAVELHKVVGDPNPPQLYLLRYNGGVWSRVSQGDSHLFALSLLSDTEGWAAGTDGAIARLHDGAWTQWGQTAPTDGTVTAIQMVSAGDGWLAGAVPSAYRTVPNGSLFLMRFDGTTWRPAALPGLPTSPTDAREAGYPTALLPDTFGQFSMVSATDGWAVGSLWGAASFVLHYSGGAWQLDPFAVNMPLNSISMVSADEGWAVGSRYIHENGNDNASVLVHYSHGVWSVYKP